MIKLPACIFLMLTITVIGSKAWAIPHPKRTANTKPAANTNSVVHHQNEGRALTIAQLARQLLPSIVRLAVMDASGKPIKLGSGFVVGPGLIATNIHVIRGAHAVTATFESGRIENVFGSVRVDEKRDLAIIYADTNGIRSLPLMTDSNVQVGDPVIALGNPEGFGGSISTGIISQIRLDGDTKIYQTTAPISHGSSGGALVDMKGRVVGVTSFFNTDGQNINFAYAAYYVHCLIPKGLPIYTSWADLTGVHAPKWAKSSDPPVDPSPEPNVPQQVAVLPDPLQLKAIQDEILDTQNQIDSGRSALNTFQSEQTDLIAQQALLRKIYQANDAKRLSAISRAQSDDAQAFSLQQQIAAQRAANQQSNSGIGAFVGGLALGRMQGEANNLEVQAQQEINVALAAKAQEESDAQQYEPLAQRATVLEKNIAEQRDKITVLDATLAAEKQHLEQLTTK